MKFNIFNLASLLLLLLLFFRVATSFPKSASVLFFIYFFATRTVLKSGKYYTLILWSRGKQLVLFSRESCRGKHQDSRENKTNKFPEGPCIKCFVIYLDFHITKTNKQRRRAGNNCAIVSRSGYIWIWSGARDQESTNHSAQFVEWKSSYRTINNY